MRIGGGVNHRFSLGDMVLVKNNHIDAGGGVSAVLTRIMKEKPRYMPVEVEVRTIPELKEVLPFSPSIIMLDNMGDEEVKTAVALIRAASSSMEIEVSGGVTPERLAALKAIGVTCVSMGALTTKAPNLDISMKIGSF